MINYKELAARVKAARKDKVRKSIGCGNCLLLDISAAGRATYFARFVTKDRKQKKLKLGAYEELTLKEAHAKAMDFYNGEKEKEQATIKETEIGLVNPLFKDFIKQWLDAKEKAVGDARFSNLRSLCKHLSDLGDMRLRDIKPQHLIAALNKPSLSAGAMYRAACCFNQAMKYAKYNGYIDNNPCEYITNRSEGFFKKPKTTHLLSVEASFLRENFFGKLENISIQFKIILLYILLSGARLNEALNLRWSWIDFDNEVITIPAEYMKMRREHKIPISPQIKLVLEAYRHLYGVKGEFVFFYIKDLTRPIPRGGLQEQVRVCCKGLTNIHGLRATMRSWMAANDVKDKVAELCLAHVKDSLVEQAYQRYDMLEERREALNRWGAFVLGQISPDFNKALSFAMHNSLAEEA